MYFDRERFKSYLKFIVEFCWSESMIPAVKEVFSSPGSVLGVIRIVLSPVFAAFYLFCGTVLTLIYLCAVPLVLLYSLRFK